MELKQLRCFLAVAEELGFGRAAHRLNMLPSALGRHVRLLEEELGAPLFLRTTRHVSLTPAGAALLPEAGAILDRANAAMAAAMKAPEVAERLAALGVQPEVKPRAEWPAYFAAEYARWGELIRAKNIRIQ